MRYIEEFKLHVNIHTPHRNDKLSCFQMKGINFPDVADTSKN